MTDRRRISVMDFDDQFNIVDTVVGVLESFGVKLDDYQLEILMDEVMEATDEFSVGFANYNEDADIDED